ncbi:MAG: hypothetical protein ACK559_27065, partial [bacterium]
YITIIEASPDDKYHLKKIDSNNKEYDLNCNSAQRITDELSEIDKDSGKYLENLQTYENEQNSERKKQLEKL